MGIKLKNRDPKTTDFSGDDIVINHKDGTLFYKSDTALIKLGPSTSGSGGGGGGGSNFISSVANTINGQIGINLSVNGSGELTGLLNGLTDQNNVKFANITSSGNISSSGTGDNHFGGDIVLDTGSKFMGRHHDGYIRDLAFVSHSSGTDYNIFANTQHQSRLFGSSIVITSSNNLSLNAFNGEINFGGTGLYSGTNFPIIFNLPEGHITASGNIKATNITSSGNISASGNLLGNDLTLGGNVTSGTWQGTAIAKTYIGADAIDGTKIEDDAINSEHYTDGSIDSVHLANNSVTNDKMADDSIDSAEIVDGSIDTAHIADDQVTYAKIQNVTQTDVLLGRDSSGAGNIEEISPTNVKTMLGLSSVATVDDMKSHIELQMRSQVNLWGAPWNGYSTSAERIAERIGPSLGINSARVYSNTAYGNASGVLTLDRSYIMAGWMVPFNCTLTGVRAISQNVSSTKPTSVEIYSGSKAASAFNNTANSNLSLTLSSALFSVSCNTPGQTGNPMPMENTSLDIDLTQGDMLYPRWRFTSDPGSSGLISVYHNVILYIKQR